MLRAAVLALATTLMLGTIAAGPAMGETNVRLFKIITVKDEIVVGLTATELASLGDGEIGAIAAAIRAPSGLTVWRFAVRKNAKGELEYAPSARIALFPHDTLRVEPYKAAIPVIAGPEKR